jgi:hypothetical protein
MAIKKKCDFCKEKKAVIKETLEKEYHLCNECYGKLNGTAYVCKVWKEGEVIAVRNM